MRQSREISIFSWCLKFDIFHLRSQIGGQGPYFENCLCGSIVYILYQNVEIFIFTKMFQNLGIFEIYWNKCQNCTYFQNARNIVHIFVSASRKLWHWEGYIEKSFRIRTVAADAAKQQANQQLPLQGRGSKVSSGRRLPKIEAKSSRVVGYTAAAGWSTISGGQTWFLEQTCVVRPSWGPISTIRTFARQSHHFGLWVRFPLHFPVQLPVQCSAGSRSFWQVMSVSLICVIEYFAIPAIFIASDFTHVTVPFLNI